VLRSFEDVQVTIRPEPLMAALEDEEPEPQAEPLLVLGAAQFKDLPGLGDDGPSGTEAIEELAEEDDEELPEVTESPLGEIAPSCIYCGGSLPTNRTVNFCPHCGQSQTQILCPECRSEVEPGWRHCVNCGAAVGEA
jgi:hypothetical protein